MRNKSIVKIFFAPPFFYCYLEKWLNQMSKKGLKLVYYKGFAYYFKQTEPSNSVYFVYNSTGYRNDSGKYSISLRYPCIKKQYGLSSKLSMLNKSSKEITNWKIIIEIDTRKIDAGFDYIVKDRNKIYFYKCFRDLLIILVACLSLFWAIKTGLA